MFLYKGSPNRNHFPQMYKLFPIPTFARQSLNKTFQIVTVYQWKNDLCTLETFQTFIPLYQSNYAFTWRSCIGNHFKLKLRNNKRNISSFQSKPLYLHNESKRKYNFFRFLKFAIQKLNQIRGRTFMKLELEGTVHDLWHRGLN